MASGTRGVPVSSTLAGPPERMTPRGVNSPKASAAFWNGTISQ